MLLCQASTKINGAVREGEESLELSIKPMTCFCRKPSTKRYVVWIVVWFVVYMSFVCRVHALCRGNDGLVQRLGAQTTGRFKTPWQAAHGTSSRTLAPCREEAGRRAEEGAGRVRQQS